MEKGVALIKLVKRMTKKIVGENIYTLTHLNLPNQLSAIIAPINGNKYARLVNVWNKTVASSLLYDNFLVKYNTRIAATNEKIHLKFQK